MERIKKREIKEIICKALKRVDQWFIILDFERRILHMNDAALLGSGYRKEEIVGESFDLLKTKLVSEKSFFEDLEKTLKKKKSFRGVFTFRKKDGSFCYIEGEIIPIKNEKTEVLCLFGRDITKEAFLPERFISARDFDPITDLPHSKSFITMLRMHLARYKTHPISILVLDILDFAGIISAYGIHFGQRLLLQVAKRLKDIIPSSAFLSRTETDEFLVALPDIGRDEVSLSVRKILEAFSEPFELDGIVLPVFINIGVSLYPEDGKEASDLFNKAFFALERAKKEGKNTSLFYSKRLDQFLKESLRRMEEATHALKEGRIIPFVQPFYSTFDEKIEGLEILLRLEGNDRRIIPPSEFIELFEETGLITKAEEGLIEEIERFSKRISFPVSINLSAKSIKDRQLFQRLKSLQDSLPALILEIPERLIIDREVLEIVREMKTSGVKIAIDDFGKGIYSLSFLAELPADILKIDMELIGRMTSEPKVLAILQAIIDLSKRLNFKTCAEGVEKEEQKRLLRLLMCDYVQGFYFSRPVPLGTFLEY